MKQNAQLQPGHAGRRAIGQIAPMAKTRQRPPIWRRGTPPPRYDIALLRPADLPRGQRFETLVDARRESERSEQLLKSFKTGKKIFAEYLQECRAGDYVCDKPYCPVCARLFRRWLIGELLRLTDKSRVPVHILTILLEEADRGEIDNLALDTWRHLLRKRLKRAGLAKTPAIGGFELVHTRSRTWMLHINLMIIDGDNAALAKFEKGFGDADIKQAIDKASLTDRPEQLSYLLKFTTYHRPRKQRGGRKTRRQTFKSARAFRIGPLDVTIRIQRFPILVQCAKRRLDNYAAQ